MRMKNKTGLLVGKKSICAYLEMSDYLFGKFIILGMPARYVDGRWYAHIENLEVFFRKATCVAEKQDKEETDG